VIEATDIHYTLFTDCHTTLRFSAAMVSALDELGVNEFTDLHMMLDDKDMCAEVAQKVRGHCTHCTHCTYCTHPCTAN
jgi:hypothetical protein